MNPSSRPTLAHFWFIVLTATLASTLAGADAARWNLDRYQAANGLSAVVDQDALVVTWTGDHESEVRARFAVDRAQPVIRELAVRGKGGSWAVLGRDLKPEYQVTTGRRRADELRLRALRDAGIKLTPEAIDHERWLSSWDAPLAIPGMASGHLGQFPGVGEVRALMGLPRTEDEVQRASSQFRSTTGEVKTDGARLEVSFDGLSIGSFSGRLHYTFYRGTNLIRQEAVVKTEVPFVAYKYAGGLSGFSPQTQRLRWRDTGGDWQKHSFGGTPNQAAVALAARNRVAIVEGETGSVAVFPPPHKFFFSREVEVNLGYVWYRKNDATSFAIGVRHADSEQPFRPAGATPERRASQVATGEKWVQANFPLYNAPPGTWQRMAVFYYVSRQAAVPTQEAVLAFTNGDRYRPLAGRKVLMSHVHAPFTDDFRDANSLDLQPAWIPAIKARGVDIITLSDRGFSVAGDPGPIRFPRMQGFYEASRRHSDLDFAILSGEEQTKYFPDGGTGHWISSFPKPVMWSQSRLPGQPFEENDPVYGKVYHVGSSADMLELLKRENGAAWMAHQREKFDLSPPHGYLEQIRNKDYFRSDYYFGGEFRANVPTDLSEERMAGLALEAMDDMNNWIADTGLRLKTIRASTDTYNKSSEDDIYPQSYVNYVRLDQLPTVDDATAFLRALRDGDFFVSSGEILLKAFALGGKGPQQTLTAEFDWTFPLEFVEVVWGDGNKTDRKIIAATDLPPFGNKRFTVPFETAGKKWVRVAAWDSAGNGAFSQPIRVISPSAPATN
ncbi:MAG: hypothetical protein EXS38_02815 [Opitutus sp.]|nr:hypothetical protein [Opitutus sp.]